MNDDIYFMTVYGIPCSGVIPNPQGIISSTHWGGNNVTYRGDLKAIALALKLLEIVECCRISQPHLEIPLSENLTCRYSWKNGQEIITPRKKS